MSPQGRPFGSKDKKKRVVTPAMVAQRQVAWAKALEKNPVEPDPLKRKKGQNKVAIKDGFAHLKVIKDNVSCVDCEIRHACKFKEEVLEEKRLSACPLYHVYRNAIVDVIQNPLVYVSKKAAELEVDFHKQKVIDKGEGEVFSQKKEKMLKILLEIAKISERANKSASKGGRRMMSAEFAKDVVIDADAFE